MSTEIKPMQILHPEDLLMAALAVVNSAVINEAERYKGTLKAWALGDAISIVKSACNSHAVLVATLEKAVAQCPAIPRDAGDLMAGASNMYPEWLYEAQKLLEAE